MFVVAVVRILFKKFFNAFLYKTKLDKTLKMRSE